MIRTAAFTALLNAALTRGGVGNVGPVDSGLAPLEAEWEGESPSRSREPGLWAS